MTAGDTQITTAGNLVEDAELRFTKADYKRLADGLIQIKDDLKGRLHHQERRVASSPSRLDLVEYRDNPRGEI